MATDSEYIYLLHEREFIKSSEPIYKIGKTTQENTTRFKNYPKGSRLLFQIICNNCHDIEKELIKIFIVKYKQRKDIGLEYFEGDYKAMIKDIFDITFNKEFYGSSIFNTQGEIIDDMDTWYEDYRRLIRS